MFGPGDTMQGRWRQWQGQRIIDYFGGMVFAGGAVTCPVDDPTPLARPDIRVPGTPARFYAKPSPGLFFLQVGKLAGAGAGSGCDGPLAKIARYARSETDNGAPVVVVDLKAGFEDTARGVITSMDWAIIVVDPTYASIEFAGHMREMAEDLRTGRLPATHHLENPELVATANRMFREALLRGVSVVLNKIQDRRMKAYVMDRLATRGIVPSGVLYDAPSIARAWLQGTVIETGPETADVDRVMAELEERNSSLRGRKAS